MVQKKKLGKSSLWNSKCKNNGTRSHLEKRLWFTVITIVLALMTASGCDPKTPHSICGVEDPLTDLPWLKAKVDEITNGNSLSVSIYRCIYGNNETGFLVDEGNTKPFYNCKGEVLCIMGGFAGETCSELKIVKQELIWIINN